MNLVPIGILLVIAGFLIILFSTLQNNVQTKAGGVVLIGPFPIVLGSDKDAVLLAVAGALIIMVLVYILFRAQ